MKPLPVLATFVFFVAAVTPADACWWGVRYWGPPVYYTPYYYAPPVAYYQPLYVMPVAYPQLPPPRVVPHTAPHGNPQPMPQRQLPPKGTSNAPLDTVPYAEIKPAALTMPMDENSIPKSNLPMPMPKVDVPKLETPKVDLPKTEFPKLEFTAPKEPEAKVPGLVLPPIANPDVTVPKLTLPPLTTPLTSTSKFRPGPRFDIAPLAGTGRGNQFTLKFENQTDADITLSVHGQTVTLAARHTITATVPASFRWKLADRAEETATVADDVGGYVVAIK